MLPFPHTISLDVGGDPINLVPKGAPLVSQDTLV